MNLQTKVPTFPLGYFYETESMAILSAIDYSRAYRDHFIYVIHSTTTGKYRLDYIGLKFSDEQILLTIKDGEKTL